MAYRVAVGHKFQIPVCQATNDENSINDRSLKKTKYISQTNK